MFKKFPQPKGSKASIGEKLKEAEKKDILKLRKELNKCNSFQKVKQ
jgi:hypothetical protein